MMKQSRKLFLKTASLTLALSLIFSGCGQKGQGPSAQQQSFQGGQNPDQAPDLLTRMEGNIETVIRTLGGPAVQAKEEKNPGGTQSGGAGGKSSQGTQQGGTQQQGTTQQGGKQQQGTQQQGTSQQGGKQQSSKQGTQQQGTGKQGGKQQQGTQQQGTSQQGGKQQSGKQQSSKQGMQQQGSQQQAMDPWSTITPVINELHYQWNSFMPLAVKKGANSSLLDGFSTALNSLTNTVIGKNKTNTLLAANHTYLYIPDFYALYKSQTSPEIKKLRFYTRNSMLNAMTANWKQADTDLASMKASWSLFKNTVSREQQPLSSTLDLSIMEFDKVVKEQNQPLVDIKGRVTLSNIEALENASSGSSSGGGQGGSSGGGSGGGQGGSSGGGSGGGGSGGGGSGGGSSGGGGSGGGSSGS